MIAILLAGSAIRLWMILTPGLGFEADQKYFADWTRALHDLGFERFFQDLDFYNYPPLTLLILWVIGHLASLFDPMLANDELLFALLKVPACAADLAAALILYFEGRRIFGASRGAAACALYYLNPVSFYQSAYWGQVDAIHTALLVGCVALVGRRRWTYGGVAAALAVAQKLQSIALLPLVIFELYRLGRWRALGLALWGAVAATALVWAPFASNRVLDDVLYRGYVHVVGQYPDLSRQAFNLWYVVASPEIPDTSVPEPIARIAAAGRFEVNDGSSWFLKLTWRNIALAIYSLGVAVILALYSRRPGPLARFGAAGLLGLAFFLLPTEMHERYALPAIAFLSLWALSGAWHERLFFLLSATLALNLTRVLNVTEITRQLAGIHLLLFVVMGAYLAFAASPTAAMAPMVVLSEPTVATSRLIAWFRKATIIAVIGFSLGVGYVTVLACLAPKPPPSDDEWLLSAVIPSHASQEWGELHRDRAVNGGLLHVGQTMYFHGLGTHAKSKITYDLPEGYDTFEVVVGINRATIGRGSALVAVEIDGKIVVMPEKIIGGGDPVFLSVPITGARKLTLWGDPTEDGNQCDHVDWALARLVRIKEKKEPR